MDEIADIVDRWAREHDSTTPCLVIGQRTLTRIQLAAEIRNRTPLGLKLRQQIKRHGFPVGTEADEGESPIGN